MGIYRDSLQPYQPEGLFNILTKTAQKMPDKVAIVDIDRSYTYSEFENYVNQLANTLLQMGVTKGDRVGILSPNCAEFEISFFGIIKSGATVTTINSGYRELEIAHQLNNAEATIVIVHEELTELLESARSEIPSIKTIIPITKNRSTENSFWDLISKNSNEAPNISIDPYNDLAALPYSSGTTGLTKGVMLTHANLHSNVRQLIERPKEGSAVDEKDVVLVHLPLFHIYGMNVLMSGTIAVGGTQVLMGRFDMDLFLDIIDKHKVTFLYTVPPIAVALSQYPSVKNFNISSLRAGFIGAAPLSGELQSRLSELLQFPIAQGYGLTESSPITNVDFIESDLIRPGSIGPAVSDTEEKVVDVDDENIEMPSGEVGELLIRGPQIMQGYYNNPTATAETITSDGWLKTGDIVKMDKDGYVWILDRKKELIKYKGFQVPPAELEGILLEHDAVSDVAVIGKLDMEAGEIPKAFVVTKQGHEVSEDVLMEFVAQKVATFKRIREIEFIDTIPKNPSGKLLRRVLKDQERSNS
tara:strand:+ start:4132 stop:5715 length:1584 start_codon:yes stop_codon:yes gene_type:complete